MDDCLLASELGNRAREIAAGWCCAQGLTAWERGGGGPARTREQRIGPASDGRVRLRNLVVREGRRTGRLQVRIVTTDGELDAGGLAAALAKGLGESLDGVLWTRSDRPAETTQGGETELVWGEGELPERLGELDLRISAEAFFQTNTEMAEVLYGVAADLAGLTGREKVFDLFSGIGTIALTLSLQAGEVWGVEQVEGAVANAISNARLNGVDNARFFAGDVRTAMRPLVEEAGKPDVVVVDPPRAGLSQKIVRRILEVEPQKIVYVSCNPTTLAPNARQIADAGYTLKAVQPVDMFPQTPHTEAVALLERNA
jgi:23S rRNA (uracil1939-C5)-methyltransferase